jgi:hypothetical protein
MGRYVCLLCLLLSGCKKESELAPDIGYDFYPTTLYSERIFEVDSIVFNDFTKTTDTFSFFLKERLEEVFTGGTNQSVRVVNYRRESAETSWKPTKTWAFTATSTFIEEQTDNLRTHTLVFPVKKGEKWDANRPNTLKTEENEYLSLQSETVGEKTYPAVVHIKRRQIQDALKINTDIAFDKYAKGIGLVYRHRENIKRFTTGQPGETPVDSGLIYTMTLHAYSIR